MGEYLDGQTIIELIKGDVVVDWDMYAHALCGGGVLLEFVYRLCRYVMSCVIQHMVRA